MSDAKTNSAPVFYTRDSADFKGTKISLWHQAPVEGKNSPQYKGTVGNIRVQLWEQNGSRGPFFNVKAADEQDNLVQLGTANAFVSDKKFNSLAISLRFDSEKDANDSKAKYGLNEAVKKYESSGKTSYFINLYADVSRRAIEANRAEFERLKFNTEFLNK